MLPLKYLNLVAVVNSSLKVDTTLELSLYESNAPGSTVHTI